MTYAVFIVLEDEDTEEKRWFVVDHLHSKTEAEELVETLCLAEENRTGIYPTELDG